MISSDHLWLLALALILDAIVGDPDWLWRRLPHPVVAIGRLIDVLDRRWNHEALSADRRRARGVLALLAIVAAAAIAGLILERIFSAIPYGWLFTLLAAAILLAGRSLYDHVAAVAVAHDAGGIAAARAEIAKIVGRDPDNLDEAGLSRAAIETLAENFSDALVAPAFWFAVLGLPGLLAYKAINTADSMIGHLSPRHRDFGWASARLDDVVNLLPARLSVLPIALSAPLTGWRISAAFKIVASDARSHRSPNAGWPEAAMAGALDVALSGPRTYGGVAGTDPVVNTGGRTAAIPDIRRALRVYTGAWAMVFLAVAVLALAFA